MVWLKKRLNIYFEGDDGSGTGGASSGQDDPFSGFSGKMVEKVDPVSGQKIKMPVELDSVIGHFISQTRKESELKFKPMIDALENEKADLSNIKAEFEKLKEASMTVEERAQANAKKVIDEHERKMRSATEDAAKWKEMYFSTVIGNDILSSFGDVKLCNPQQVAVLFKTEGEARVEEKINSDGKPSGKFETRVTLTLENDKGEPETIEGTPSDLFKRWIALDRNAHHIQNDIMPGAGSKNGTMRGGKIDYSKLPPKERLDAARQAQR